MSTDFMWFHTEAAPSDKAGRNATCGFNFLVWLRIPAQMRNAILNGLVQTRLAPSDKAGRDEKCRFDLFYLVSDRAGSFTQGRPKWEMWFRIIISTPAEMRKEVFIGFIWFQTGSVPSDKAGRDAKWF